MAHRSQCSSAGDNPLDPNYLPPHYREEYRMAIDALVDTDLEGYYGFLKMVDVVDFLSRTEIEYIKCNVQAPYQTAQLEKRCMTEDVDGSSDTYWPVHSDHDAPGLDLGWPQQYRFVGPTEVTTLVNPPDPEMPSIKEQVRRMIKSAQQVIAVVMDMFTDVDIFADILGAATRGVAVYVLLDELNAQHFVAMVNNCRVNLDEIKFMRVRTVSGSTYSCRTGKSFKGQMMSRFILVDCRAVLSGNYSFMWSFEKIHRCLAHLFLGQLVTTFDEEFRILFAHSEPLVVENVLANMPHYDREPEGYYNTEKTHMFNRQYPAMGMEWAERSAEEHMNVGHKMLPFRSESIHSAGEANPSVQRHMNLHAGQQHRGGHQFIEHGRQMRGPTEMVGLKRHSYGNIPDYEYLPPQNHPTMKGNQYIEGAVLQGGHFARDPNIYQGAGLQSGYDMYGKFTGQGHHIDQFSGSSFPHEGDEAEPTGAYDHVQRYLQSHSAMEEEYGPRNVLPPVQSNIKRHSRGQSYTCQTSPTQPNLPEQKRFFNVNRKPQDMSQKQGLRDWRISSYLSAYDDAGELDLAELEGSSTCSDIPCFTQEAPCGPVRAEIRPDVPCFTQGAPRAPVRAEIRPGNREFNRVPAPRENPMFVQIQNDSVVPDISVNHPTVLSQINIKTTPTSTSESSCTTEGDKMEETQNREPKETNRISEEFLKRKPSRPVQRSSRLRHSLIFSSNLELNTSGDMKDTAEEKEDNETSKPLARVSHILDKKRTSSTFQPFQWSNFVKSATFDNSAIESAQPEDELNKLGENSDLDKVENSQKLQTKGPLQEKDQPQTAVPERRDECPSNLLQKSSSLIDMNDPDCRLRYFKELAAKRKLAAAKVPQSNPVKATQKFTLPEKPSTTDADKNAGPVFKTPETTLKTKNTTVPAPETKETCKDTKCEESSKDIMHRATDAEKIQFKKRLAEESGSTFFQKDTDPTLKPVEEAKTVSTAKNQTSPILNIFAQKPFCALSGESTDPCASSSSEPCSKNSLTTLVAQAESVAFNTPSTESGLIQFHSPKETDHSHAVLTGSCPPVKLPQTKCMSPLCTTQSEGSLFANDSQTLAQSSPNISSTCSDTVSLDSNSKPSLAIVDTCVPSKRDHINNVPSPSFSTAGISSSQHPTATKADSFQHLTEIVEDFSRHSTAVGSEPSAAESACSQHPSAAETDSSQQTAASVVDSSQHHTTKESDPKPTATGTEPYKQSTPSATDSSQQPTGTVTDSSQPPIVIETDSSQKPIAMETNISQQSTASVVDAIQQSTASGAVAPQKHTAIECELSTEPFRQPPVLGAGSSHQPTTTVTHSSQPPTAIVTDSSQKPTAIETDTSQQSTASVVDAIQQPTATETDSSQQPTATVPDSSQQLTAKVTDSSRQPTATITDSSQQLTAKVTDSSRQPTATITDSSQQSTARVRDTTQKPNATETDSSQQTTATITDSSQHPTATETVSSQQCTATITDFSQKPTATETDSSQQPTTSEIDISQQPSATVTDSSQQPTTTEIDASQQPSMTETDFSQQPTATETDSSQKPTATVTDSSQQPTATETDSSQKPTATVTDSSQQPTATETDSSQKPTATETDSSQKPTATETDSSQQPTATETDSSQKPTATETDSSQKPTATETDSSQQPTATETDSSQKPTATVTDSSQKPTATVTDSSQKPTATETNSSQQPTTTVTDSSQQPATTETDSSQKNTSTVSDSLHQLIAKDTDLSQKLIAKDTDLSQQLTVTESESSQNSTKLMVDTSKHPIEPVNESLQHINATESDCEIEKKKKDDNLSEPFSKPVPDAKITQADNSVSQITVITDLSSTAEHSQSDTVPPCDSQTQAGTKPRITPVVKDTDNDDLTSLNSVEVSSTQPLSSPQICLSTNEINSTQGITQLQSCISSNPMESSCINDSKPEKTDECQKNETITEHSQRHESSAIAEGPEITQTEVSTAPDPKQTTPEVENFAEGSEKSDVTIHSNSENSVIQSSVAKNAKSIMSAHQSSTANVISCSNLRDDTKVLLEQISAKNQRRSSQSKETLAAPNEAKEGEVSSADKLFSNYLGRPWSSKATPEERDMVLQKMEKMRKERKVYSRFEAS
ncbi:serine-rich adhesin for platelets [Chanodichthys erythropterus]|uniref:serine-rich adhesin for platelets n=1 Tax=Chanodichthys erythropterus TaxID=933992 RepID=UPI00351E9166